MADQTVDPAAPQPAARNPDIWAQWLLEARFGGDAAVEQVVRRDVERFCRRVRAGAGLGAGMTFMDVGAGEGVLGLGAVAQIGPSLKVIFTDISAELLDHARGRARELGVEGQCRFLQGSAERLEGVADASVDAVGLRASLAYVPDKMAAFREFIRVLKPGGRLSMAEPIMQDEAFETCALGRMLAAQPGHPDAAFLRLMYRWKAAQYPATEEGVWRTAITNFSERDLVRLARQLGFSNIHMELHIDYTPAVMAGDSTHRWQTFLAVSPHPGAPSLGQILAERFSADERAFFEREMRPKVESQAWQTAETVAYLTAVKSGPSEGSVR